MISNPLSSFPKLCRCISSPRDVLFPLCFGAPAPGHHNSRALFLKNLKLCCTEHSRTTPNTSGILRANKFCPHSTFSSGPCEVEEWEPELFTQSCWKCVQRVHHCSTENRKANPVRTSRKQIQMHLSRRCIGCKPFVSSENGRIQSKGSKTPEWSSVVSVQSVQYKDEK